MFDLYAANRDDSARYLIGNPGSSMLVAIGLNPSTANREKADTTIAKVARVSEHNSFDGFAVMNLYPQRATVTQSLPGREVVRMYTKNLRFIENFLTEYSVSHVWAAWGGGILLRDYFGKALGEIVASNTRRPINWLQYGPPLKAGHPRHPSRLSYAWSFSEFDINTYLKTLKPIAEV